ncbi:S9 family peptidase [Lichenicola sp.]|uniref:S9 family peptidase n=1 Tax=Lichenicola sp. TaxID=2804529 RepID=UPI003B00ACF1
MKIDRRALLVGSASLLAWSGTGIAAAAATMDALARATAPVKLPPAPITARHPVRIERWGMVRTDDYQWLRDPDWFTKLLHPDSLDRAIRAHLDAENAYCAAVMLPTDALQAELVAEMQARSSSTEAPPPEPDGAWLYWSELRPGAQQPVYLRRPRAGGPAEVLFDFDTAAGGRKYYRLSSLKGPAHSPDGRYFAWTVDERGDEHFTLHVLDLATRQPAFPPIEDCFGEFVFSPDSHWIFWLLRDEHSRPTKVFRRPVTGGADVLVHDEHDPAFFIALSRTAANGYVLISIENETSSEIRLIRAGDITAMPVVMEPRTPGLRYAIDEWGDRFVVRTNADGALDNKLMLAPTATPGRACWRAWIPYRPGRYIDEMRAFRDHFARIEWIDANPVLVTVDAKGSGERQVRGDDAAYVLTLDQDADYDSSLARFSSQSPRRPLTWETVDMATGVRRVLWQQPVAYFDMADYVVEQLEAPTADGVRVPISLLRHRGTAANGKAPLFLYGYGSYGYSLPPEFSAPDLSLADRGWMVAIAHVRGGSERGQGWFTQTLTTHKRLTITDFVDCAAHLVETGYTAKGRIVGHSFSAGGILIGGAINLRPDLFAGAIGQVPFVDVLNTMQDDSNPLVKSALPLWGDPADPAMFRAIAGYAPYETIRRQPYPAVLATAGLLDDRVGYWEAAKWVARLRENSTSGRPVMLLTNMHAGHQGDAGEDDLLRQHALFHAFAIRAVSHAWG